MGVKEEVGGGADCFFSPCSTPHLQDKLCCVFVFKNLSVKEWECAKNPNIHLHILRKTRSIHNLLLDFFFNLNLLIKNTSDDQISN